jgi:hypothetical protein
MVVRYLFVACFLFLACVVTSCGGGGGSDDGGFSGAGTVVVSIQPSSIDVGDRTRVTIRIYEVNEDGVLVKVNFPDALSFVANTAVLVVDGDEIDVDPEVNVRGDEDDRYLVYFFTEDDFDRNAEGTLRFELQANDSVNDGLVSVDIDVDDPTIANNVEFSVDDPQFQAEDVAEIEVDK